MLNLSNEPYEPTDEEIKEHNKAPEPTFHFTQSQLHSVLSSAIGFFQEYREVHGHHSGEAEWSAIIETLEGLIADQEMVKNGDDTRLRLQSWGKLTNGDMEF